MSEDTSSELSRLEEEGELAADYLEELLDIADLDGDIEIDVENGRALVEIISEDPSALDNLVGEDGEVVDALQELTRKADLQDLTHEAIARLRATGEPQKLEPMNPFERKVCHDVVASEGLRSESEGVEPRRRVVILPADESAIDEAEEA